MQTLLVIRGSKTSVSYHVVTPELGLMYDGEGYFETSNDLPRQAAIKAPELEKAEKTRNTRLRIGS